jgi:hypothetical protein
MISLLDIFGSHDGRERPHQPHLAGDEPDAVFCHAPAIRAEGRAAAESSKCWAFVTQKARSLHENQNCSDRSIRPVPAWSTCCLRPEAFFTQPGRCSATRCGAAQARKRSPASSALSGSGRGHRRPATTPPPSPDVRHNLHHAALTTQDRGW